MIRRLAVLGAVAAAAFSIQAQAQSAWPTKAVRIVVPFPPAGAVDISTRAIANELARLVKEPVTVENRPGAGGNIGGAEVAKSAPDGHTLLMTTSGIHAINPVLYAQMPFDPNRDLAPVVPIVQLNNVLVVHPSMPVKSVPELIALLKANPGKFNYASSGSGTTIHLSAEMFKSMTGTDMTHIPYRGSAPAVTDLLAGTVNMMFDNIPSSLPHIKAGKLRALATTGARRAHALPDLPTLAEAGLPGYEATVWFGFAAPAGTPREVIARINAETQKAMQSAEYRARMAEQGYEILGGSPERMAEMLQAEIRRWGPVVRASGAKVD